MTPELKQLLTARDQAAWASFVDRYLPVVVSAVRRTLPHAHTNDVEDVIQDVFLRLCQHDYRLLRSYSAEQASITTWLTVVARGVAIDAHRKSARRPRTEPFTPTHEPAVHSRSTDRISLPAGLLSPRETAILTLLFDHDLDVEEVAEKLAIHPQTVRSTKHNALTKLRKHQRQEDSQT
jgi:RNA polymerase sigma-70 factor (ECF subfamily)